ncbi:MAG: THUMP domain-containing class I SAM-dependent RNA methyltransferase [Verrucomicrobiia bacterium]
MIENTILVTCPKACSSYLRSELEELGYEVTREAPAGVFTKGTMEDCMRLNLLLRNGLRVLWEVGNFRAYDGERLYQKAVHMPWETWIPADGYVSIGSSIRNDTINNTNFASLRLKDAMVDRIRERKGQRPDTGNDSSKAMIFLYWHEKDVCIYLDTSGVPISNRGYRVSPGQAPMRENLAASVIRASRWDRKSAFVNPMCGSGTLAIEAALLATNRPAGILRDNFAFMHLEGYRHEDFEKIRSEIKDQGTDKLDFPIIATDRNTGAVDAALRNAEFAGVEHLIEFDVCDFKETRIPEDPGVMVFNPEYGDRMGEEQELVSTYQEIGDLFKQKCPGYWGYIFTGNPSLGKRVGLKTKRKIEFYNGPIECRLLEYELYSGTRIPKYVNQEKE